MFWIDQDFRFSSFPRQRESNNPLQRLDIRFHGYDDKRLMSESPVYNSLAITSASSRPLAAG